MRITFRNPIAVGGLRNGAFVVDIPVAKKPEKIQYLKATQSERLEAKCNLWLGRFGFAGPARIIALARDPAYKIDLPKTVTLDAFKIAENDIYQLAKSRERPHRNLGMKITATKPFEMIHIDCITRRRQVHSGCNMRLQCPNVRYEPGLPQRRADGSATLDQNLRRAAALQS